MSEDEDRLARWSRLKLAAVPAEPEAAPDDEPQIDQDDLIAALPKLDEIGAATDIRGFLNAAVPQTLRAAALSRAWLADPAIRDRIPDAIDYAEDYNAPHTISGWGGACPEEAARAATRAQAPEPRIDAGRADVEPRTSESAIEERSADGASYSHSAAVEMDEPRSSEPAAAISAERITAVRRKHGGAMPEDD